MHNNNNDKITSSFQRSIPISRRPINALLNNVYGGNVTKLRYADGRMTRQTSRRRRASRARERDALLAKALRNAEQSPAVNYAMST
ncbi:hypothetical protein EVAR_100622_1 [Eumeta japonica]|uniref:Uncharacterized protein n=1 Tax=Eumeta variegata TaxID=151549 RepID=A0A4C1ZSA7_EUMVA|nr:hypothetical protein EVAR_100622_1 [Eumeta japonica]